MPRRIDAQIRRSHHTVHARGKLLHTQVFQRHSWLSSCASIRPLASVRLCLSLLPRRLRWHCPFSDRHPTSSSARRSSASSLTSRVWSVRRQRPLVNNMCPSPLTTLGGPCQRSRLCENTPESQRHQRIIPPVITLMTTSRRQSLASPGRAPAGSGGPRRRHTATPSFGEILATSSTRSVSAYAGTGRTHADTGAPRLSTITCRIPASRKTRPLASWQQVNISSSFTTSAAGTGNSFTEIGHLPRDVGRRRKIQRNPKEASARSDLRRQRRRYLDLPGAQAVLQAAPSGRPPLQRSTTASRLAICGAQGCPEPSRSRHTATSTLTVSTLPPRRSLTSVPRSRSRRGSVIKKVLAERASGLELRRSKESIVMNPSPVTTAPAWKDSSAACRPGAVYLRRPVCCGRM